MTPPPRTKAEVVQEFRCQAILEAVGQVVAERGVEGATIEAIAEAAGIAKGTVYLYFKNRQDLVNQAVEHAFEELGQRIRSTIRGERPFRVELADMVATTCGFFDHNRHVFRLYMRTSEGPNPERYNAHLAMLAEWIRGAIARGEARAGDAELLAQVVADSVSGLSKRRLFDNRRPLAEDVATLVGVLLDGFAVHAAP